MSPLVRSLLYAALALTVVSCTVWEKTPISLEEAVGVGKVKVTSGTMVSLEEAVNIEDGLWVVFNTDSVILYDYISFYENHYFGFVGTAFDSLNQKTIKAIFTDSGLSRREYHEIVHKEGVGYYGKFRALEKIDTSEIFSIYKLNKKESTRRTAFALGVPAVLIIRIVYFLAYEGF